MIRSGVRSDSTVSRFSVLPDRAPVWLGSSGSVALLAERRFFMVNLSSDKHAPEHCHYVNPLRHK